MSETAVPYDTPAAACWCRCCHDEGRRTSRAPIVCPDCGDATCQRANHHGNDCTGAPPLAGAAGEGEKMSDERLAEMHELHDAWLVYRADCPKYPSTKESIFLELVRGHRGELLAHVAHLKSENTRLRAKLATEDEQERELLKRDEELRGLRAGVVDMNRQIGEAHRTTGEWIAECGRRAEGRKAAEQGLLDYKESILAGLKEAYGQGDWLNIHHIVEELKAEISDAGPLLGDSGKEGRSNG